MFDVIIVGAGVIGGMLARQLSAYALSVCILEKENDVGRGASCANSGIVHGGFDPEPGTLKAKLNAVGVQKLFDAAAMLHVPVVRNGSFVCAFGAQEEETLRELYQRGIRNGVEGMQLLSGDEARQAEPHLSPEVTAVLSVPCAGIVCPYELTIAAVGNAMDNGAALRLRFAVEQISREQDGTFTVRSRCGETVRGRYLVNCAGAYSGKLAAMAGDEEIVILPRAGEYLLMDRNEGGRVSHTIFRVPSAQGKGILVTPTVDGNLLVGPTATLVDTPEQRNTTSGGMEQVQRLARGSVPSVDFGSVITSFCGVRASTAGGDFIIRQSEAMPGMLHVAAIDSPGLSCCVSIAEYAVEQLRGMGLQTPENPHFDGTRPDPHAFRRMNDEQKHEYIRLHPDHGRIVCRCEGISEGEIRDAIRRTPQPTDLDGVKRRTRSGMGRCQGGFCTPHVMRLLSEELGIPMQDVTKKGAGSPLVLGKL